MELIDKSAVVTEIERRKNKLLDHIIFERDKEWVVRTVHQLNRIILFLDTLEAKEVDFERELSKYVSNGIHRFFPNVDDDYCKMDSVIWQDYVIETAKHFYELGLKAQKGE